MLLNLEFDSSAASAPQSFRNALQTAATIISQTFNDDITVNLAVGYGEITLDGSTTTLTSGEAEGGPSSATYLSYSSTLALLSGDLDPAVQSGVAALPQTSTIQGQSRVVIWAAEERALGLANAAATAVDGAVGFATDISSNLLVGVALHELTHALGRTTVTGNAPDIFDLFRFSGQYTRLFGYGGSTSPASYFSLNGGASDLADYATSSDPSDFLAGGRTPNDPFSDYYNPYTLQNFTPVDVLQMQALGFHTAPYAFAAVVQDFNGDGLGDLLWRNDSGDVAIWTTHTGAGGSVYVTGQDLGIQWTNWQIQGVGDFNGDGLSDILWLDANGNVDVWAGTPGSSVSFASQYLGVLSTAWHFAGIGDINGDGRADILWRNDNGDVSLWEGLTGATPSFVTQDLGVVQTSWHIAGMGDFNGDGRADVLWWNDNGDIAVWTAQVGSGFAGVDLGPVPGWQIQGVGDFNGDGKADIVWRNTVTGDVGIWESQSTGSNPSFVGQDLGPLSSSWHFQNVVDMNGDGLADIVWRNDNGDVSVWLAKAGVFPSFTTEDLGVVNTSWHIQSQWLA
jgi:hypothetical protein